MSRTIRIGGIDWPTALLERTSTADLGYLAGIADPQGECVVCQHPLGDQPWAAVVDTAAGPRGAWSAEGGYAHPSCAPEQDVNMLLDGRLSYFAAGGLGQFAYPALDDVDGVVPAAGLSLFPMAWIVPALDAFTIGCAPGDPRLRDFRLAALLDTGWHRLRPAVIAGRSVDFNSPEALAHLDRDQLVIETSAGETWTVDLYPALAQQYASAGLVIVVVSPCPGRSWWTDDPTQGPSDPDFQAALTAEYQRAGHLYPGALYGAFILDH